MPKNDLCTLTGHSVWVMAKGFRPDEGGMQTYAAGVADAYAERGARVTVFTQTSVGPRQVRCSDVWLHDVGPGNGAATFWRLFKAVKKAKQEHGPPSFVHGTTWRTSVVPMLLDLPYLVTFHGREFMGGGKLLTALMHRIARKAICVVTVSNYSARKLCARLGEGRKPVVAHNGTGLRIGAAERNICAAAKITDAPTRLFSLCRLEPRKNIAACVRAARRLKDAGYTFHYVIAGRGPEYETLKRMIAELDVADVVDLVGFVSDETARRLYAEADIFIHPQMEIAGGRDFEGFGIAIADAMLFGSAVIVGQEGGAVELVEHGHSGLIVNGRDDDQLTQSIESLLVDESYRRSMAKAGHDHACENFTWMRHVEIIRQAHLAKGADASLITA
ncbi:glycosyltransferase family 4 protein [Altericroceibacterium endophyticum]|uniref:Glycosyltransferase n=1 Tax=Altericroceibacterium endophyticum TaxID=1808508 RepID=A0A6I4T574_9SPHN|nr:glycosyltransferase family 4 protein [Altericroceibacterium endophyticum]MXO66374.1 glycosyltransferase [Altericroceibacterium endophyticum]